MTPVRLFDSDWHDGMAQVASREWSEEAAHAVASGGGEDHVDAAWAAVCAADFCGAGVSVDHGGSGLELGPLLEIAAAAGAALFPTRLAFESLLPSLILGRLGESPAVELLLTDVASGGRLAVALAPEVDDDDGVFVHGAGAARGAPRCLIVRTDPASVTVVEAAELREVTRLVVLDGREIGLVELRDLEGMVLAEGDSAETAATEARWLAALLAAADALGAAATALDRTIVYAGQRNQFGVPIGSFQAVKHAIVDRFLELQIGRALLASASESQPLDLASAAMAKAGINDSSVRAANSSIQLHGAVGFTDELGLHLYQRRVLVDRELFAGTGTSLALVRRSLGLQHTADPQPRTLNTGAQR